MPMIKLRSSDNECFEVDLEIVVRSSAKIRKTIDILGGDLSDVPDIPLPEINSEMLKIFIEYATYHKDDPIQDEDDAGEYKICNWDSNFLKFGEKTMFEVLLAANHLEAKGLLKAACHMASLFLANKTPEELREKYGLPDDFSPEEKAEVERENDWLVSLM